MKLEEGQPAVSRSSPRRGHGTRVASSLSEINVVPLVDVMLVLLVIFMVAAPMMQQGFAVQLPKAKAAPIETRPVTIIVPRTFHQNHYLRIGDDQIPLSALKERVTQALSGQLTRGVVLDGDADVTLQDLVTVFGYLQAAGVENVGIAAQPPTGGGGQ